MRSLGENFRPINHDVLVKLDMPESDSIELIHHGKSGFVQDRGEIVSIGSKVKSVKPGQRVLITPSDPLRRGDPEKMFVKVDEFEDLLAVLE